ncbi:MAG: DUF1090 family protein [Polaromonas sp.]
MKQLLIASLLALAATPLLADQPSAACAAKRARIESEISQAQAQGRQQQLAGLQKALRANQSHCTDALLAAERESDIQKATKKVAEREQKLKKAQAKGDPQKIAHQQGELDKARSDLTEAQKPLLP